MRLLQGLIFSAVIGLSGCVGLPQYSDDAIATADIIRHIRCEIRDAAWSNPTNSWITQWNAALTFEFEVFENGSIDSDNSIIFPLNAGGTFPLALTAGITGNGTRTERIYFVESLAELKSFDLCTGESPGFARLEGRLGIDDLFVRAGRSIRDAGIAEQSLTQLDYNLVYVLRKTASLTPRFQLIPIGGDQTFTGSLRLGGEFRDTQLLKITLKPPAGPPRCRRPLVDGLCPQPVYQIAEEGAEQERKRVERPRAIPKRLPTSPGRLSPAEKESLERGSGRNVLESIEGELRRQRLD